jgi:hypothetical protein
MWFAYTNNFANWHILKIEKYRNHRRKQIENKVSSLEDYAVEVIQETKDFNNAMGQESLTALINLKEKTNKNQSQQWKNRPGEIYYNKTTKASKYHPIASEKKPAITRKP